MLIESALSGVARGEADIKHDRRVTRKVVDVACRGVDEQNLPVWSDAITFDMNIEFNDLIIN